MLAPEANLVAGKGTTMLTQKHGRSKVGIIREDQCRAIRSGITVYKMRK